jgi:hypothetical protein
MSRYMGLNAFGTDNFLRGAIRSRLLDLRRDDHSIHSEGVDELSTSELKSACQSRGIRTSGVSPARLREELSTWIQLHLNERVSGVLLILGRAFYFDRKPNNDEDGKTDVIRSLESVMSGLPDNLVGPFGQTSYDIVLIRSSSSTKLSLKSMTMLRTSRSMRCSSNKKNSLKMSKNKSRRR